MKVLGLVFVLIPWFFSCKSVSQTPGHKVLLEERSGYVFHKLPEKIVCYDDTLIYMVQNQNSIVAYNYRNGKPIDKIVLDSLDYNLFQNLIAKHITRFKFYDKLKYNKTKDKSMPTFTIDAITADDSNLYCTFHVAAIADDKLLIKGDSVDVLRYLKYPFICKISHFKVLEESIKVILVDTTCWPMTKLCFHTHRPNTFLSKNSLNIDSNQSCLLELVGRDDYYSTAKTSFYEGCFRTRKDAKGYRFNFVNAPRNRFYYSDEKRVLSDTSRLIFSAGATGLTRVIGFFNDELYFYCKVKNEGYVVYKFNTLLASTSKILDLDSFDRVFTMLGNKIITIKHENESFFCETIDL